MSKDIIKHHKVCFYFLCSLQIIKRMLRKSYNQRQGKQKYCYDLNQSSLNKDRDDGNKTKRSKTEFIDIKEKKGVIKKELNKILSTLSSPNNGIKFSTSPKAERSFKEDLQSSNIQLRKGKVRSSLQFSIKRRNQSYGRKNQSRDFQINWKEKSSEKMPEYNNLQEYIRHRLSKKKNFPEKYDRIKSITPKLTKRSRKLPKYYPHSTCESLQNIRMLEK